MAFVGIKKLIKEDKEETKRNTSAIVAEQIKAGLLAGLGKKAYPEDWQDTTTGRVTTPKTTTTTETAPKTTTARKTVTGTPRGTENIARTISPETAPVSPLTQRFSQESVAARLGKSSNTVRAEDPWVNWLIENGHIDNTGRVQGKVTGPISKEAYRELEQNMSDYKARNRIAADTGTAFGNVQRNSPLAQYNSLSPDDKASFYRAGSDKVRDITSFAGAQQYVAGLGYDVSEAWQEMHKWDTTLKNHQKAGQEQNKRRQDLENMLPESGVIRQRLVHGAKVPFTERPDNYNDYSEEYDRQLYDFFYGKGEHDKIMKIGNRQQKEKLMDDLNEMWRNVDNGTFAAYDQQNRQITDNLLKEERANMLAEYAEDQKKQAENDYNTAKGYQAFMDPYREKYDGISGTAYAGQDLGRTSFNMHELERGVHTSDADRIYSFLTGGKEYQAYKSMYTNGNMQVTDEYDFAMLMKPEEQEIFKQIYTDPNGGKKAAEAFMAGLKSTGVLQQRYSEFEKIRAQEFGREFPVMSVAASLMNDTANTVITPFRTAAGFLGYEGASDPNDVSYKPAMTSEYLQAGFTDNIRDKFGDTAAEAAGVALNTVQNVLRGLLTRGLGLADKAQEVASLALFGVDVFGKNTYKYLDQGYGLNESYMLGGIDSAIEVLEEKIPTDVMLGGVGKSFWTNLRNSAISEWIQEGAGATAGEKLKGVLTGEDSERKRAVELFAEGMTDENGKKIYPAQMGQEGINLVSGKARKEYVTDAARSAFAGLAGGGLGAAYGGIVNTANNINLGRAINSGTNTVDGKTGAAQLAALAKESNDAEIREAGEKLDKKIAGGKGNPSNYSVGKLAGMLYQGTAERMQTVVQDTMVRSIRDQIMTGAQEAATRAADAREAEQHEITQKEAQHYAEIIAKSVLTGKNPSNTELQELSKSEDAIQAWKSFNTRERVADMAAEIRKEAAPMNSVMDTLGDLTSKTAKSRSAAAPDIDAAIKEAGGDTATAIDNLQARRSDLISESFAGKMKDILKSDKGGKQSKNFLDDAVKIMLGAKTLAKTAPKTRLDSETAQKLFDAAKEEFEAEDNNRVLKQETVKPGEGKASFEGVEYGTKEWQQKVSGLSKTQRNQMGALGEIATRAGLKVTFINDAKRSMINGYENNDGSIVINIAARNRSGLGHHMLTTMSHEMTHWLEQNSREGYNALRQFIVDGLRNSGTDVETRILQIMDNQNAVLGQYEGEESQGLSVNGAMAELVAQGCENLLSSETMMQELAEANPSAFSKVKTFVTNFVARIRNAVKGMSGSLSYEARTLIGQTEQIARLWSSARAEALARNAEEGTVAQAGTQYSMQQATEQAQEMDTEEYRQIAEQEGLDAPQMLRYSMVGPRAGGDYAEMIRQARQMEKQGEDAETIFRETGARKGFRGHWWVTLDNQNIRMKENFDTANLSQYAYDLADVMDAEELMAAYPQLGVVKVQAQEMGRAYAAYVKDQNTIVLNEEELKKNPGKINVALRHEIQHVIQDIEGANGGANMSRWQDIISRNNLKEDPLDLYWRTAGELEANITSKDGGTMPTREQYDRAVAIEDYAPGLKGWKSRMEGRLNRHFSMADISAQDREYAEAVASGDMKKATEMLMEKLKHSEDIIPYSAPHGYGGQHKTIARMIKEGTPEAVARAAQDLATYVPDNAVLVPMPPHEGTVTDDTDTMILARAIGQLTGRPVVNALASNPRESRYQAKSQGRKGLTAEEMGFRKIAELPEGTIPIFVDNVVGSGETAKAANLAMGGGVTLAYAKGTRTQGIRGLKEANVTYDKDGKLIPLSQRFNPEIRNVKYSTAELNAAYMDAAERGDTETAKKLMEAYAAGRGYTIQAYHGTGRADRVGTVFLPERATSGPMAFFTDNRSIAENYARDKQDTSIAYDEEYGDYFHQFRVPGKNGKTIPVGDLWKQLSLKEKREITEKAKHINWDENVENIIFDPDTNVGNGGFQDWTLREKHGNAIEALIEAWLQGGDLYGREADFLDVLKMVGIENATWNDPDARHEKVYDVFLKIQNPFSTGEMYNQSFLDGLAEWWEEQDWDAYQKETANADPWDKNSRSVEDWIEQAERDLKNGSSHAWTSIPDAVTDYLKSLGHDGIQDVGGKNGGETHTVWIPFSSEQVKSAEPVTYDDQGNVIPLSKRFNSKKTDIRYSTAEMDEQYMQAVRDGDEKKTRELTEMAAENEMKKSRIRTKDGKLRKVYHGTNSDTFTVFDKGTIGMGSGDTGYFGRGFYFAYSRGEAGMYGRNVMEAYVNIENPFNFEKELNTYNGVKSYDYNASRAVFLMNWADKFPELTKGKTIRVSKIGSNDVENISYKQFADEFKKIYKTKKFDIEETEENGEKIWLVTADKHKESFTNEDGETFEWDEYGFQRKYYNERDARNQLDNAYAYMSENVYDMIKIPASASIVMDSDLTETLKARGYDGVIQSEDGDEVVAFESNQIKLADPVTYDDQGNVIPLSERFNYQNNDIRYSTQEAEELPGAFSVQNATDMDVNNFMMGLQETQLDTLQEKTMLRQYKDLKTTLDVQRLKIDERTKELRKLEAKKDPNAKDRNDMIRLRNMLDTDTKKRDRLEEQIVKVTSSEGYAGLMYRQHRVMMDLANGKTADDVRRTISGIQSSIEGLDKQISEREAEIREMADSTPIKAIQAMINDKDLDRLAAYLRKTYNSKTSKQEIMQDMAAIRLKMANRQKVDDDIETLTRKLIGGVRGEGSVYLDLLRGMTITLSRDQVKELAGKDSGIAEVRRMLAGSGIKVKQGKAGGSLDANWSELCDMIPALNRDTTEKDQIDELIRFVQSQLQSTSGAAMYQDQLEDAMTEVRAITASVGMDMAQDPAAVRVVQRMMGLMAEMQRGMKGSAAELKKAREQLAEMSRQGTMAGRLSGDMEHNINSTIEYLNKLSEQSEAARWRKERVRLIEQLKSETTEKLLQEQAKWKARIEKDKTVRGMMNENMNLRKKINTNMNRVQKLLINETDQKNVPEHLKGLARLMVMKVLTNDLGGGRKITGMDPEIMAEKMRVLRLQEQRDGSFDFTDLDMVRDPEVRQVVADALADIEDGIAFYNARGGKDIIANLQGMKNALTRISEAVSNITSIISAERHINFRDRQIAIEDAADDVMEGYKESRFKGEWKGFGSKAINAVKKSIGYGNMTPVYYMKNLRNRGMMDHWREMEYGEHKSGLLLAQAKAWMNQLAEKTHYKDWADDKITVQAADRTMTMDVQSAMSILAIWKREHTGTNPENSSHIENGGIHLKEKDENTGRLQREKKLHKAIRLGDSDIAAIRAALTDEQLEYMDKVVGYLSHEMSELGNETSMRMYGIKKFKEDYYFPMKTWSAQLSEKSDAGAGAGMDDNRAAHKSWSKRRTYYARTALEIGNFTEEAVRHITEMINYNTMAPVIENLNKTLNFQVEDEDGIKRNLWERFEEAYGKEARDYLKTLLRDMNGGAVQDQRKSLRDRALSMFKKNAVAGSLSVAAQQPLSYVRAAMMLSPRDLAQAIMPQYYRGSWAEMMKHSGVAVIKEMGRFDMNFGQSARDFVSPDTSESLPERVVDKLNVLPELMDRMTWTRMWSACKIEQHRLHPEMDMQSDAFLDLVGERFNDVMRRTQVYDSVLVKSSNMRSQNLGMKVLTSFMAEPTVSLNVLEDAVRNARDKGGMALVAKAGTTFALSAVLQALVKGIMGAGRSPDDKKTAEENFLYKWQTAFMSEANPLGLIPGYSDLIEVLKNGELTDDAMSAVGKLKSVIDKAGKAISGQGQGVYRDLEDTAGQLAQMFTNIPAKNIMRDMRAMLTWLRQGSLIGAKDFANRESSDAVKRMQAEAARYQGDNLRGVINTWLGEAGYKTTNKAYYGRMYDAMKAGDQKEADDIREYLTLGKGVKEEAIDSGLRSQAKADSSLGEAERSEWLIDQGLMSGTNTITSQLKEGKISADEARKLMQQADPEMSTDDIWWKVDQISWQRETGAEKTPGGKNYRLMEAVGRNKSDEINKVVKEMMAHGVTQKQIKDYMGDLKQEYLAADSKGKVRIRDAIQKVYKAIGLTAAEADKRIKKWK